MTQIRSIAGGLNGPLLAAAFTAFGTAPALAAYEEAKVVGGARIEGTVVFNGVVPVKKIIPNKDVEVCGGARDQAEVLVGPNKEVLDAVVYLKDVSKGKAWGKLPPTPTLNQKDCRFEPAVQIVRAGALDILNSDPVLHNTHGFYGKRTAFNLAMPNKGDRITKQLTKEGPVRVECDAHGWMLAWVHVADSPYFALTSKNGSFSLTDVPPGEYVVVASHSYTGETETKLTVKAGETAKLSIELKKQ